MYMRLFDTIHSLPYNFLDLVYVCQRSIILDCYNTSSASAAPIIHNCNNCENGSNKCCDLYYKEKHLWLPFETYEKKVMCQSVNQFLITIYIIRLSHLNKKIIYT